MGKIDYILILISLLLIFFWMMAVGGALERLASGLTTPCSHLGSEWVYRAESGESFCRNMSTGEINKGGM